MHPAATLEGLAPLGKQKAHTVTFSSVTKKKILHQTFPSVLSAS
jgi:hypothetical protein